MKSEGCQDVETSGLEASGRYDFAFPRSHVHTSFELFVKGWGILFGIPALFVFAYLFPHLPLLRQLKLCAVQGFLGVPCPGCGLTRSIVSLVHGRLRESIDMHPLGIVVAVWFVYLFVRTLSEAIARKRLPELLKQTQRNILIGVFLMELIANWVVKLLI